MKSDNLTPLPFRTPKGALEDLNIIFKNTSKSGVYFKHLMYIQA
jgi:hypothetical protein